tara:strand:+ start:6101 stop:6589 length:489 start_codon:yes stop_codon:yes gene_type:complete
MANGQQQAKDNFNAFKVWVSTQSDDDFKQIIYRGQLSRTEISKVVGCGKSALRQNPEIKAALNALENTLREKRILPPLTENAQADLGQEKEYNSTENRRILGSKRASVLEVQNVELQVIVKELEDKKAENIKLQNKVEKLESKLQRFSEQSEVLQELGLMPR